MSTRIQPYPKFQAMDANGNPRVGAKLFTYEPGTTTKKDTYTDSTKTSNNTNPIILDANGEASVWLEGQYKFVLAPSTDSDPPTSPYWTEDNVGEADISTTSSEANHIQNGSFEVDTDGDGVPDNWTFTAGTGNTLEIEDTADPHHGKSVIKAVIGGANTAVAETEFFEVYPGVTDIYRWALKCSAVDATVVVRLSWYTVAQSIISTTDIYSDSATNPVAWTEKWATATAPATARYAKLSIRMSGSGKTIRADNFRSEPNNVYEADTTVSGNWIFTGNVDLQGTLIDSTGTITLNDNVEITGALTAATVDTGQGATEVHLMDQNVRTSDNVSFANLTATGAFTSLGIDDNATSTAITINSAENFGFGTTDIENWSSTYRAMQLGVRAAIMFAASGADYGPFIYSNIYFDGDVKYRTTGPGSAIYLKTGNVEFLSATSGTQDTVATLPIRAKMYNDGGWTFGTPTGASKGAGTLNVENGIYCDGARNTRTVVLDTPELITSSPTTGAWTTVNNTTLNNANAVAAIIKSRVSVATGSAATTDQTEYSVYLRKTGSGLASNSATVQAIARADCSVVGEIAADRDLNTSFVALDGSYDFDYYVQASVSGSGGAVVDIYLIGYIQNC